MFKCANILGVPSFSLFMTSDFVTSVSCVLDTLKSPKMQNNSWNVSHRMQRTVDHFEDLLGEYPVHAISRGLFKDAYLSSLFRALNI